VVTDATVDAQGRWTAGPFVRANGHLLDPGAGATLRANSYTPSGVGADDDMVTGLTIT
jgi:hypothetical protein